MLHVLRVIFLNKMEFELEKLKIHERANFVQHAAALVSTLVVTLGYVACIFILKSGLAEIVQHDASAISALGTVIDALHLEKFSGALLGILGVGYGYYERKGKKRAIARVSYLQERAESSDVYRGSSKLTKSGDSRKIRGSK